MTNATDAVIYLHGFEDGKDAAIKVLEGCGYMNLTLKETLIFLIRDARPERPQ